MANTLKFGNGEWYGKKDTILAYNSENNNYKPLPFDFSRGSTPTGSKATTINKDGLIETVGNNVPRIDYKDDSKGALLLEPTRSNNITYSDLQSQGVWYPSPSWTVSDNSQISPKGILDASSLTENLTNGYHSGYYQPAINNGYTGSYTISCFAKYNGRNIALSPKSATERTIFDLQNGSINQLGGGGVTAKIENYGSGWYRCSVTCSFSNENVNFEHLLANNNSLQYQGDGFSGIYIYGCQAEEGSYPTSYIPTQGGVVTRLKEEINNQNNLMSGLNDMAMFLDYELPNGNSISFRNQFGFRNNSNGNFYVIQFPNSNTHEFRYTGIAGVNVDMTPSISEQDYGLKRKLLFTKTGTTLKVFCNGVQVSTVTNASATTFNPNSQILNFGANYDIEMNVNNFKLYNNGFTDQEAIALTTI
mgnify:CR=1 FL=1